MFNELKNLIRYPSHNLAINTPLLLYQSCYYIIIVLYLHSLRTCPPALQTSCNACGSQVPYSRTTNPTLWPYICRPIPWALRACNVPMLLCTASLWALLRPNTGLSAIPGVLRAFRQQSCTPPKHGNRKCSVSRAKVVSRVSLFYFQLNIKHITNSQIRG